MDPRHGKLVEPMFLGGLSIEDTADVLRISFSRVQRDLTIASRFTPNSIAGVPYEP